MLWGSLMHENQNPITNRTEGALSRSTPYITPEQIAEFAEKPLRAIPTPEIRPVAWEFWASWQHLLPTQLTLAMRLRRWITNDGLTLADVEVAFDRVNKPERAATYRFAADLLNAITGEVAAIIQQRKRDENTARQREADEKAKAEAAPPDVVRKLLAGFGGLQR